MERLLREQLSINWRDRVVFIWWNVSVTIKHWFGIHTMILHEEVDFIEEVVQLKGMICPKCGFETR